MNKNNDRVPVAILSCFLIAFILQGFLKLLGVFVFEKVLDWEIFTLIDNHKWLQIIYYSLILSITIYCLSFALTSKPYSKKWFHYVIIIVSCASVMTLRTLITIPLRIDTLIDVFLYILIPFTVNLTSKQENRLFKRNLFDIVLLLTIQIALYFCYLGLEYWSMVTISILPINTTLLPASTIFVLQIDEYIGLVAFMLSMNILIKRIKEANMKYPLNIASEEAKRKELERVAEIKAKRNQK